MKKRHAKFPLLIPAMRLAVPFLAVVAPDLVSATGVFKPGWELPFGEVNTVSVTLVDADGDGDRDAWILRAGQPPKILSNDGAGTLTDSSSYFSTSDTSDIAVGDVDNDGDQDALVIPYNGKGRVWLNNGSAQLTDSTQSLGSSNISQGSMLADVNDDGHLDALLKNTNAQFEIWTNNGAGVFTNSGNLIGNAGTTNFIALGDFDLDGDPDAWVTTDVEPRFNRIWTNDGSGVFTDSGVEYGPTDAGAFSVAIADIDGDLDMDILAGYCCQFSGGMQISDIVWRNDGTGIFVQEVTTLNMGSSVQLVDVNNDGYPDAVSGRLYVLNDTTGNFTGASQSFGDTAVTSAAVADLTGNGFPDLYRGASGKDTVWFNDGAANFADSGQRFGVSFAGKMALGDLDGDSDRDVWLANQNGSPSEVWLNDGSGNFTDTGQELGSGGTFSVVELGDLDGDGDVDAFVGNYHTPSTIWLNDGSGNFSKTAQDILIGIAPSVRDLALGDLDGDGDLDAWIAQYIWEDAVWLNNGSGTFSDSGQQLVASGVFDSTRAVALGDVDNDGDLDAWVGYTFGGNNVWLNDGSGMFTDSGQSLGSSYTVDLQLADVDNDLDLDAFTANFYGPNKVWLNDGAGVYTDSGQELGSSDSVGVSMGDVNDDGFVDTWVANSVDTPPNKVWINDGTGVFQDSNQSLGSSPSRTVKVGDLNGDGKIDAFVSNTGGDHRVWINQDNYCSTSTPLLDDGPYTGQVYCGAETKITAGPLSIEAGADVTFFSPLIELLPDFGVKEGTMFNAGNSPLVDP